MAKPMGIALVGCGTVGTGVVQLLTQHQERLAGRANRSLELRHVVVRNLEKERQCTLPTGVLTTNLVQALNDPQVDVIAELIGGTTTALQVVLDSLAAGKHVVTANKALLAEHGPKIFDAARKSGCTVEFEAAVAGGVPIIRALAESLSANRVTGILGILNGTSNFILTSMAERNISYAEALAEAQERGYAEADPTLDVDGTDAAHKLAILAQIAFGVIAQPSQIARQGIEQVTAADIGYARELGYTIKLLAEAWVDDHDVALHVAPVLLRKTDMLAQVRGAFNAVQVVGDAVGETMYQGLGAGMMPTASAVVSDLIDLAVGRGQMTFAAAKLWSVGDGTYSIEPSERVCSRFYLRAMIEDKPGVLAELCRALANEGISITSVIQHESVKDGSLSVVPLIIMTHTAETSSFMRAVERINANPNLVSPAVSYSVVD